MPLNIRTVLGAAALAALFLPVPAAKQGYYFCQVDDGVDFPHAPLPPINPTPAKSEAPRPPPSGVSSSGFVPPAPGTPTPPSTTLSPVRPATTQDPPTDAPPANDPTPAVTPQDPPAAPTQAPNAAPPPKAQPTQDSPPQPAKPPAQPPAKATHAPPAPTKVDDPPPPPPADTDTTPAVAAPAPDSTEAPAPPAPEADDPQSSSNDTSSASDRRFLNLRKAWLDDFIANKGKAKPASGSLSPPPPAPQRVSFGLSTNATLQYANVSFGVAPGFGERRCPSTPSGINQKLPVPMAVVAAFHQLDAGDSNLHALDYHVREVQSLKGDPVYALALMPMQGLDSITPQVASNIGAKMKQINDLGITVWLRFGHEMNGNWYPYGNQPAKYVQKWRLVAQSVHEQAPKTFMLWAPNSMFGSSVDDVHGGFTPYWPGQQYVDMVGLSLYSYGGLHRQNIVPADNQAVDAVKLLDQLYGTPLGIPLVIAETSASYTYDPSTGAAAGGGASEVDIKTAWLRQLMDGSLKQAVPSLISITWFDIIKDENGGTNDASGGSAIKTEDYRLFTGQPAVAKAALDFLATPVQEVQAARHSAFFM